MKEQSLSIDTLCGGAVQERINRGLRKVADNILDPNTEAKKKRSITVKLTFTPNEDDREDVMVDASVLWSLAPEESAKTQLFVNKDIANNNITIQEHARGEIKGQLSFDDIGFVIEEPEEEPTKEELGFDPDTGEILDEKKAHEVIDFRAVKEG